MKKSVTAFIVLLLVCGCSDTQQVTENALNPQPEKGKQTPSADPDVAAFNQDLSQLAELARDAESKYQFASAAKIWGQLHQLFASRFGNDAWQTINANLAYESAFARSQFSNEQLKTWKQVENLQAEAQQHLQAGNIQAAYTATRQLAQLQKQLFGGESFVFGQSLVQLATLDSSVGQFEASVNNFNDSLQIFDDLGLLDHPERIMIHAGLANAYNNLNKLKTAAANQKEATRIAGNVWGKQSLEFAMHANQLAAIYHRAGNLQVAVEIFEKTLAIRDQNLGGDHQAVAHACLNLGVVLLDLRRLDESQQYLSRANRIFVQELGSESAIAVRCQERLATTFMLMNAPEKAEPLLSGIIKALATENAPDSDAMLTFQYRLAIALARQGKYDRAEPLLQSVLDFQQQKFGDEDKRTIATLQAYSMLLERTNRSNAANPINERLNRVAHLMDDNDFQRR